MKKNVVLHGLNKKIRFASVNYSQSKLVAIMRYVRSCTRDREATLSLNCDLYITLGLNES